MEYVRLNNGVSMPVLGLGTFPLKGKDLQLIVKTTYNLGYRLYDTAWLYKNENDIGELIKKKNINGDDLFLTSKLHINELYFRYICRLKLGIPKRSVSASYDLSCSKLGVSKINLYILHAPFCNCDKLWNKMSKLYNHQKMDAIGVSNFTIKDLELLKSKKGVIPSINQIEISPFNSNRELIEYCWKEGIVVEAFSPFGRGLITKDIMHDEVLCNIAQKYNKSIAQVILRWLTQQQIVSIPRSTKEKNLKENIDIFDFKLDSSDVEKIYSLNKNIHTVGGTLRVGL